MATLIDTPTAPEPTRSLSGSWQPRHTVLMVVVSLALLLTGAAVLTHAIGRGDMLLAPVGALTVFIGMAGLSLVRLMAWLLSP